MSFIDLIGGIIVTVSIVFAILAGWCLTFRPLEFRSLWKWDFERDDYHWMLITFLVLLVLGTYLIFV